MRVRVRGTLWTEIQDRDRVRVELSLSASWGPTVQRFPGRKSKIAADYLTRLKQPRSLPERSVRSVGRSGGPGTGSFGLIHGEGRAPVRTKYLDFGDPSKSKEKNKKKGNGKREGRKQKAIVGQSEQASPCTLSRPSREEKAFSYILFSCKKRRTQASSHHLRNHPATLKLATKRCEIGRASATIVNKMSPGPSLGLPKGRVGPDAISCQTGRRGEMMQERRVKPDGL